MKHQTKRQIRRLLRAALFFQILLLLPRAGWSQNLLLEDYRPPVSSARALRLNADLSADSSGESADRSNLFANYRYFYDSLPFAYFIDVSADALRSEGADDRLDIETSERARAFMYGDLFGGAELRRAYRSTGEGIGGTAEGSVGFGYGRFINATPLAKAARMEEALLEMGMLRDDFPAQTMIELGQIIQRESEYREQFGDTYRQEWFKAMERAALESGMLIEGELSAAALLMMDETLLRERVFDRYFGWEISLGVGADLFPLERFHEGGQALEASYRLAKPIGWRLQWNETLTLSSPMDADFGGELRFSAESELSYEVSNRIDLTVAHQLNAARDRVGPDMFDASYESALHASFSLFIENALTLNSNFFWNAAEGERRRGVSITFGYRLF